MKAIKDENHGPWCKVKKAFLAVGKKREEDANDPFSLTGCFQSGGVNVVTGELYNVSTGSTTPTK
jgi:hypothetical protein